MQGGDTTSQARPVGLGERITFGMQEVHVHHTSRIAVLHSRRIHSVESLPLIIEPGESTFLLGSTRADLIHIQLVSHAGQIGLSIRSSVAAVVRQYRRSPRHRIVRVRAGRSSSAFLLVSEFRPIRGCAWKCPVVRPCC
ncbi:hypothetical protein, partial [Streptomyces sp. ADI98-12]|uniref:hypothetical protein n=1 Tax=Streptomyces sp. ADI98-12 TaxID=1522764 RepID=UPI001F14EB72